MPNQLTLGGRDVYLPSRRTRESSNLPVPHKQELSEATVGGASVYDRPPDEARRGDGVRLDDEAGTFGQPQAPGTDVNAVPEQADGANATLLERALWTLLSNRGSLQFDQRQFLSQSRFDLSLTRLLNQGTALNAGPDGAGAIETVKAAPDTPGHWSLWGRGALTHFSGADTGVTTRGDVLTGLLGVDYARQRWLAGVALAYHDGKGRFDAPGIGAGGELGSTLVSVNPYLRYALTHRLSVWGTLGYGRGSLQLTPQRTGDGLGATPGEVIDTDLQMGMGAVGVRGVVYAGETTELTLKSDALWVRTASAEAAGLRAVEAADSSRMRLLLSGRHERLLANGAALTPTVELGLRYDDGDAETGFGMELGGGLRYADPVRGLTIETRARTLLAHADGGYEEWGLSGSLSLDPGRLGRGLALRLDSGWGLADSSAEALWQRQTTAGLAPQHSRTEPGRITAELGYGLDLPWTNAILTPYSGMEWAGAGRTLRLGWRFVLGRHLSLSLDGERRETGYAPPDHALMLNTSLPW